MNLDGQLWRFLLAILLYTGSMGLCEASGSVGWTYVTVSQFLVQNEGGVQGLAITVNQPVQNPGNCPGSDSYVLTDSLVINNATGLLLAGVTTGAQMQVYVTGACDGWTGRPLISGVQLLAPP